MERAAFLLEDTGERIGCLLNPESVVVRRRAGLRQRESSSGPLTGAGLSDDPILYTGGGMTEILLDLLFDVSLVGSSVAVEDVRDLTRPLTELAQGKAGEDGYGQLPLVRFVWGKAWNILGVVAATAERLEYFDMGGVPQRSWLRMRLLRVPDENAVASGVLDSDFSGEDLPDEIDVPPDELQFHELQGGGETPETQDQPRSSERLDEIASIYYDDPTWWRLIAAFNKIDDPFNIPAGTSLMVPPDSSVGVKA